MASGDSWVELIVRRLSRALQDTADAAGTGTEEGDAAAALAASVWPFFISYYVLTSVVLFNVIVAILLDELILATSADKFSRRSGGCDNEQVRGDLI